MTEYELEQICERIACDFQCIKCPIMARFQRSQLGYDEFDDYEEDDVF